MQRKLVQQGKHCFMAAIPKKWIKQHDLKKGNLLEFEELDDCLLLSAKPILKNEEFEVNISGGDKDWINRFLQVIYDYGVKKIIIKFDNPETLETIRLSSGWFEGMSITAVSETSCTIEISDSEYEINNYFRKNFMNTLELSSVFTKYLSSKRSLESQINLLISSILHSSRVIKRKINTGHLPLKYKYYYFISIQLEEITEQYMFLLREIKEKKSIPEELLSLNKKLEQLFKETYSNFYKFDWDWYFNSHGGNIWKWFETKESPNLTYHLRAISERIKNIIKYSVGINLEN